MRRISAFLLLCAILVTTAVPARSGAHHYTSQFFQSFGGAGGSSQAAAAITIDLPGLPSDAAPLEMVCIPAGSFIMGAETPHPEVEWPAHEVRIPYTFYMGRFEVTQAQWLAIMKDHHAKFRGTNLPVEKVPWIGCEEFIRKLNTMGLGTFRLPTEAEWEYACRAGSRTVWSFQDPSKADEYLWWRGNTHPARTRPVGQKLPNAWGLYDMHGNVGEWCADAWEPAEPRAVFTAGPSPLPYESPVMFWVTSLATALRDRVNRGGSYLDTLDDCRTSLRRKEQSVDYHYSIGFRLVRDYP